MTGIDPTSSIALTIAGLEATVLITVVTTVFGLLTMAYMVTIALAPHLSAGWAERIGATDLEYDRDAGEAERAA